MESRHPHPQDEQRWIRRAAHLSMRRLEQHAHDLHAREYAGESGRTPLLMVMGLFFLLLPVFGLMVGLAFTAYYVG